MNLLLFKIIYFHILNDRVADNVTKHEGYGIGVYSYFRDFTVTVDKGISCPQSLEPHFVNPLSVFLNGNGGIEHVINDKGPASDVDNPEAHYYCS